MIIGLRLAPLTQATTKYFDISAVLGLNPGLFLKTQVLRLASMRQATTTLQNGHAGY